jgi:hypothetical protein
MPADRQSPVILCGPPKNCTCPAVAWTCCCEASEHGRRMIARLACDCGLCGDTTEAAR